MSNRHGAGRAGHPLGLRPGRDEDAGAAAHGFEELREGTGGSQMKIFVAGGTGAIGRPLMAELLAKGHALVALTRSPGKAQALVKQGIEPAIADVFDTDAVKAVVRRAQPEVVIEQLTALPRTYTRQSMSAAAAFNNRIRLEGGANMLATAQAADVRRHLRQSIAFWAAPGPGLADEETPLAFDASPALAADARVVTELEHHLLGNPKKEGSPIHGEAPQNQVIPMTMRAYRP